MIGERFLTNHFQLALFKNQLNCGNIDLKIGWQSWQTCPVGVANYRKSCGA